MSSTGQLFLVWEQWWDIEDGGRELVGIFDDRGEAEALVDANPPVSRQFSGHRHEMEEAKFGSRSWGDS